MCGAERDLRLLPHLLPPLSNRIINIIVSTSFLYLGYGIEGVAFGSLISIVIYIIIIRRLGKKVINQILFAG